MQKWYEEVWNKANEGYIDEAMHNDVIIHGLDPTGTTEGIDNFKVFYTNFRQTFPVTYIRVNVLVSDDEFATGYCTVNGESETGKEVTFTGLSVAKFKEGKLVETWNNLISLKCTSSWVIYYSQR